MNTESLKNKTIKGVIWNSVETFAGAGISFIFSIILARILSPSDYGLVGMIAVFTAIASSFVDSGFSMALIRKVDRTEVDTSTVFFFNIIVAVVCYILLYISAPYIADFYDKPILKPITRITGLNLIIDSFCIVQATLLSANLKFKTSAKITLTSNIVSGIIGVVLAYSGFGVWALVYQTVLTGIFKGILYWIIAKWRPIFIFSWASFREMFSFGSKLFVSGLINTVYNNIYPLLIGKLFSPQALGYYSRASGYANLPSTTLTGVFQKVTYPVLSHMQNDNDRLSSNYRQILRMMAFIIFPVMMLVFGVADPLVRWMITDKWANCIILLQILCFSVMWLPVHAVNLNVLRVVGRSDLILYLEIIKKIVGVAIVCVSYRWGVVGMCYGTIIGNIFGLVINTYYNGKFLNAGFIRQMLDVLPIFIISVVAGFVALFSTKIAIESNFIKLVIGSVVFLILYFCISYIFKIRELFESIKIIRPYISKFNFTKK